MLAQTHLIQPGNSSEAVSLICMPQHHISWGCLLPGVSTCLCPACCCLAVGQGKCMLEYYRISEHAAALHPVDQGQGLALFPVIRTSSWLERSMLFHELFDLEPAACLQNDNGTISLPGYTSDQRIAVTSTGLNNQNGTNTTPLVGAEAQSRLEQLKSEALGSKDGLYAKLFRVLFWLGVIIAAVLVFHALLILASSFFSKRLPNILHFPRPELMVVLLAVPAIANAASSKTPGLEEKSFPKRNVRNQVSSAYLNNSREVGKVLGPNFFFVFALFMSDLLCNDVEASSVKVWRIFCRHARSAGLAMVEVVRLIQDPASTFPLEASSPPAGAATPPQDHQQENDGVSCP